MRFSHIPAYTFPTSGQNNKQKTQQKKHTINGKKSKSPGKELKNDKNNIANKICFPGPGSYETQTKFIYSSTRPKSPNFTLYKTSNATIKEKRYNHEIIAAPGSYEIETKFVNESKKTKFPQYSFWKTSGIIPKERKYNNKIITGPGCYNVKYNQDSTKKSDPKFSFGKIDNNHPKLKKLKDSNQYGFIEEQKLNIDNCENKNSTQKNTNFLYDKKEPYSENCELRNKNRFCKESIKYTISKAPRMKIQRQFTPGPGKYDTRKNLGDKGSYKYSFGKQVRLLPKNIENKNIVWHNSLNNKYKKNSLVLSRSSYKKPDWIISKSQRIRLSVDEPVALMRGKIDAEYKNRLLLLDGEENDTDPNLKLNPHWVIGSQRYYEANIS